MAITNKRLAEGAFALARATRVPAAPQAHATQEKFLYRHHWQEGDMLMWDHRCLLRRADANSNAWLEPTRIRIRGGHDDPEPRLRRWDQLRR